MEAVLEGSPARSPLASLVDAARAGDRGLDPGGDAYLVLPDRVERWPRSTDPFIGCA